MLAALKHQMFEQMGKAVLARSFVLGTDVVPDIDGNDRCLVIGVHDQRQAVVEHVFLVADLDIGDIDALFFCFPGVGGGFGLCFF